MIIKCPHCGHTADEEEFINYVSVALQYDIERTHEIRFCQECEEEIWPWPTEGVSK